MLAARWARAFRHLVRKGLRLRALPRQLAPADAYRLWSESYDAQTDNVVLLLEERLLFELLSDGPLTGKIAVDIGCGTGRHWDRLLSDKPSALHGVDNSPEMLERLRGRHPNASLHLRTDTRLDDFPDGSVDVVVSSLMLGYARDLGRELQEWRRLLKPGGEVVFTDIHPAAARAGMKRTFTHRGETFEIEHLVHTTETLHSLFRSLDLHVVRFEERAFDDSVRELFERNHYIEAYEKAAGIPVVMGFRLRRAR